MSVRAIDLAINLSDLVRPDRFGGTADFCPTASATIRVSEPVPSELDGLREQLRATLGKAQP